MKKRSRKFWVVLFAATLLWAFSGAIALASVDVNSGVKAGDVDVNTFTKINENCLHTRGEATAGSVFVESEVKICKDGAEEVTPEEPGVDPEEEEKEEEKTLPRTSAAADILIAGLGAAVFSSGWTLRKKIKK